MTKKVNLPFTTSNSKKNNSYKLMNDKELIMKVGKSKSLLNVVTKLIKGNSNENNENRSDIRYIKASDTKEYYKKLKK